MNLLYISTFIVELSDGVGKKILGQIEALEKNNIKVNLLEMDEEGIYLDKVKIAKRNYKKDILELNIFFKKNKKLLEKYDVLYMRYSINPIFYYLLRKIKKNIKQIIIEIPTYPYEGEIKLNNKKTSGIKIIIDKILRNYFLKKYVNRIVTFSKDSYISDVKCINISNGISFLNSKNITHLDNNKLNFIAVSNLHFWHGVDRFILALKHYYNSGGKEDILLHIVGTGENLEKCKKMAESKELKGRVIFYGRLEGDELDKVYRVTNIGLGSIGMHRIQGLEEVQPLKNREYCAKGLPFIISFNDPDFINKEFVYKVSNDERLFDIEKIIEWYKSLKITSEETKEYSKNFSWDIQMKKVIDYLKEGK